MEKYERNCPECGKIIEYKNKNSLYQANYKNVICYNCSHKKNYGDVHKKELGYWVDGYDEKNNIVYEFDEKRHFDKNGELLERDKIRQKEIEDLLGCKFIRIKE